MLAKAKQSAGRPRKKPLLRPTRSSNDVPLLGAAAETRRQGS
jgi:hypothetical protein